VICSCSVNDATVRTAARASWERLTPPAEALDIFSCTLPTMYMRRPSAMARGGTMAITTSERRHEMKKPTKIPAQNCAIDWMAAPSFSPIASWISDASVERRPATPTLLVSNQETSWRSTAWRYAALILGACRIAEMLSKADWQKLATKASAPRMTKPRPSSRASRS